MVVSVKDGFETRANKYLSTEDRSQCHNRTKTCVIRNIHSVIKAPTPSAHLVVSFASKQRRGLSLRFPEPECARALVTRTQVRFSVVREPSSASSVSYARWPVCAFIVTCSVYHNHGNVPVPLCPEVAYTILHGKDTQEDATHAQHTPACSVAPSRWCVRAIS